MDEEIAQLFSIIESVITELEDGYHVTESEFDAFMVASDRLQEAVRLMGL